jgi:acyl homoserine lactone synthase
MRLSVEHAPSNSLPFPVANDVHTLRYHVFRERLNWDIPVVGETERDDYDDANPIVVLARSGSSVVGCCRLLPSTGRYMLKNTFPELLGGKSAPEEHDVWEISRFAVTKEKRNGFGFSEIPSLIIREIVRFAIKNEIKSYVFVTTVGFERLLRKMGVTIERFSDPLQVGIERSVALWMHIDERTIAATAAENVEQYEFKEAA